MKNKNAFAHLGFKLKTAALQGGSYLLSSAFKNLALEPQR